MNRRTLPVEVDDDFIIYKAITEDGVEYVRRDLFDALVKERDKYRAQVRARDEYAERVRQALGPMPFEDERDAARRVKAERDEARRERDEAVAALAKLVSAVLLLHAKAGGTG